MRKLTGEEILEVVSAYCDLDEWGYDSSDTTKATTDDGTLIGDYEVVEHYGGEGQGETFYSVKYFPLHDVYIKTEGYYYSYEGAEFEDFGEEVRPKKKTITVYE